MKATDNNTIDVTLWEAMVLSTMGFICVINDGEVVEIIHERGNRE